MIRIDLVYVKEIAMNRLGNVKDWNVVKNWKFLLVGLAVVALNVLTQLAMFALPNFDGNNLLIAAVLLLLAVVLGLILTGKLGLWKGEQKWGMVANVGFVVLAFIVMFGLKIIGGQLIMLEEGYGQTTANQEIINNSGLPTLVLFLFAVFFAPVWRNCFSEGFLWGEYLVRIRLWDYCYQVFCLDLFTIRPISDLGLSTEVWAWSWDSPIVFLANIPMHLFYTV